MVRVCREGDGEGVREMVRVYGEMVWGIGKEMVRVWREGDGEGVCREGGGEGV